MKERGLFNTSLPVTTILVLTFTTNDACSRPVGTGFSGAVSNDSRIFGEKSVSTDM